MLGDNSPFYDLDHNMCDFLFGIDFGNLLLFVR